MRRSAFWASLVALALTATNAAAAPPQEPPNHVAAYPHDKGVLVDWSGSTVPVMPWTTMYEVMRHDIFPLASTGFRAVGRVTPTVTNFVDTTVPDQSVVEYCVRAVTVDGPQACSESAYYVDPADCVLLYGAYTLDLDTHCLYTTDPPLPIFYPTCAPVAAQVTSQGTFNVQPRMTCIQFWP
ncbi:MAG: hypothetical protein QOD77_106 [Thermoplasmata archaeon]|jgi:hypothetical protein|nr:hypothetical protein [Thermoplasmata archaeon]